MLDEIDFKGAIPSLGEHSPPRLMIQNVDVSIRPEIILKGFGKSGKLLAGALKLHFPRTFPLGTSAGYVSALLQEYAKAYLSNDGEAFGPYCFVIDIGSKTICAGVKATAARMERHRGRVPQHRGSWPTITITND